MKVLVIGCGNMIQALFPQQMLEDLKNASFFFYTPTKLNAQKMPKRLNAVVLNHLEGSQKYDVIWLGFKPQNFSEVSLKIEDLCHEQTHIVSLLAGIKIEAIQKKTGVNSIIKLMPNTPSKIARGVCLWMQTKSVQTNTEALVKKTIAAQTKIVELEEEAHFDELTPVSGSAPAIIFEFMKAFEAFCVSANLEEKETKEMIVEVFLGSVELYKKSAESLSDLQNSVTSKNGVTYEILKSLSNNQFSDKIKDAFESGVRRSKELGLEQD